jgi:hypothetical protein
MLCKADEPRRHRIPKTRYKIENWAEYDAALRRRGSLTIWVTPATIVAWTPAPTGRRGRPRSSEELFGRRDRSGVDAQAGVRAAVAIEAGLMLRPAFGRPWRQTDGLLGSIMDLLP